MASILYVCPECMGFCKATEHGKQIKCPKCKSIQLIEAGLAGEEWMGMSTADRRSFLDDIISGGSSASGLSPLDNDLFLTDIDDEPADNNNQQSGLSDNSYMDGSSKNADPLAEAIPDYTTGNAQDNSVQEKPAAPKKVVRKVVKKTQQTAPSGIPSFQDLLRGSGADENFGIPSEPEEMEIPVMPDAGEQIIEPLSAQEEEITIEPEVQTEQEYSWEEPSSTVIIDAGALSGTVSSDTPKKKRVVKKAVKKVVRTTGTQPVAETGMIVSPEYVQNENPEFGNGQEERILTVDGIDIEPEFIQETSEQEYTPEPEEKPSKKKKTVKKAVRKVVKRAAAVPEREYTPEPEEKPSKKKKTVKKAVRKVVKRVSAVPEPEYTPEPEYVSEPEYVPEAAPPEYIAETAEAGYAAEASGQEYIPEPEDKPVKKKKTVKKVVKRASAVPESEYIPEPEEKPVKKKTVKKAVRKVVKKSAAIAAGTGSEEAAAADMFKVDQPIQTEQQVQPEVSEQNEQPEHETEQDVKPRMGWTNGTDSEAGGGDEPSVSAVTDDIDEDNEPVVKKKKVKAEVTPQAKRNRIIVFGTSIGLVAALTVTTMVIPSFRFREEMAALRNANVGDIVSYGDYKGDTGWIVLDKKDDRVLCISNFEVGNTPEDEIFWETSPEREELNSTFMNSTFNLYERIKILSTETIREEEPDYETAFVTKDINDKVFILKDDEVKKYIADNSERMVQLSDTAVHPSMWVDIR